MTGIVAAVAGRRIAVFLIKNALSMGGNTLYDLLCAQIGLATSKSSFFGSGPKNPFSYSPVTDFTISNS